MLVVSLVITRFNATSFSSLDRLLVEYFLKRRLTISNLDSLLGSITLFSYRARTLSAAHRIKFAFSENLFCIC